MASGHPGGPAEPHAESVAGRLNWLRAGVLGANDGIVSTAGLVAGVAGATSDRGTLLTAGIAGMLAGSLSMAVGEYVSVSTQRDTERALIAKERQELREEPAAELDELTGLYERKGLSPELARRVADELTRHDVLGAHLEVELGINPQELTNPWQASLASFLAFMSGALVPLIAILATSSGVRLPITLAAVLLGMGLTGSVSARLGGAAQRPAVVRNVVGGALVMGITYAVGLLIGATGAV
jgi:VIT1/CCC1 family predicted Fe2+/Mn2+ transporter